MSVIAEAINEIKQGLPPHVELIAISKTHPAAFIEEAYAAGQRHFGENKVQELSDKAAALPADIKWHMIGHLQTNKVKYIAPFVHLIHSVDSERLLETINKEAAKHNRTVSCLMQVHIAQEETKFGLTANELHQLLATGIAQRLPNVKICGIMGMATYTDDQEQIRSEFATIKRIFDQTKHDFFPNDNNFCHISMGMSGDYHIAIQEGATLIRVGSSIFGKRYYQK